MRTYIYTLCLCMLVGTGSAQAGFFDDVGDKWNRFREKNVDPVGDKIERETRRVRDDALEIGKKVEAEVRRNRERIERIYKEVKDEVKRLAKLEKEAKRAVQRVKKVADDVKKEASEGIKKVTDVKKIVENIKDPETLIKYASADILEREFKRVVMNGKVDEFLETDLIKHVRVIDILSPFYGVAEKLDPTGVTKCSRKAILRKFADEPSSSPEHLAFIARSSTIGCIAQNVEERPDVKPRKVNPDLEREVVEAKEYAKKQEKELALSQEELELQEEYQKEMQAKRVKVEADLNHLSMLEEQLSKNARITQELLKQLEDDYSSYLQNKEG